MRKKFKESVSFKTCFATFNPPNLKQQAMSEARPQPSVPVSLRMYVLVVMGVRKNPVTWDTDFTAGGSITARGYTMHSLFRPLGKHLDDFKLINMLVRPQRSEGGNGRIGVYPDYFGNPLPGRFLSPDPIIQSPGNPQNYNRYSYALNNPLKYTDPSGYSRITNIINTLWSFEHGGSWTPGGGFHEFESQGEAFEAGIDYVNTTNSWGNTAYGSEQASRIVYNMIKNINYNYDINRNTVMHQGENRQYHFGYDKSNHTFYYVGTDTEVNPFEIIFGDGDDPKRTQGLERSEALTVSLTSSQILTNIIGGGFDAARKLQPTVSTWIKGAKVLGKTSNVLGVTLIGYDFATGNANSSTVADGLVMVGGAAVIFFGGVASAPWVAGAGVVYGIVSIAGGEAWLDRNIDISEYINFVNPPKP